MNDTGVIQETETFFRRLEESFAPFGAERYPDWLWVLVAGSAVYLLVVAALCLGRRLSWGWVVPPAVLAVAAAGVFAYRSTDLSPLELRPDWWWALIIPLLTLGLYFTAWKYTQDSRSLYPPESWWWVRLILFVAPALFLVAAGLLYFGEMRKDTAFRYAAWVIAGVGVAGSLCCFRVGIPALARWGVYFVLAYMFMLPSQQTWERSEKRSRVLLVLDVSESMNTSDDMPGASRQESRLTKVLNYLTDDNVAFLARLLDKNPVYVYRMGSRLDEEPQIVEAQEVPSLSGPPTVQYVPVTRIVQEGNLQKKEHGPPLTPGDWEAFVKYDFKPWAVRGLSPQGRQRVLAEPVFGGSEAGNADWAKRWLDLKPEEAVPADLADPDKEALRLNRSKLADRIEVARTIAGGTNVPDSLLSLVNREAGNMVQGVVVFSDGRSNLGSDSAILELRNRARRENIPVFTVAVGEDRPVINVRITDIQAPDQTPPDEPFKVAVDVDGEGLLGQEVPLTLDLFPPQRETAFTMQSSVKFAPGEPPHGQVEFVIDPAKLPEDLRSKATNFKDLIEGEWRLEARTPRVKGERFEGKEHKGEPRPVNIIKKPLRVLVFASGPTRDFQFLVNQMIRDKADLSVYLQNEGGTSGKIAMLDDPERLLTHFPDRLRVDEDAAAKPEEKWYNLAKYDVIIAFDPDWKQLTPEQLTMLQTWVELQAGGIIFVAGPFHTKQLAREDDTGQFKPLKDIIPVIPGDTDITAITRDRKTPGRLTFPGIDRETDWLRLEDDKPDDPLAGWEPFFTGKEKALEGAKLLRGFFSFYPVQAVKPGATVVARFSAPQDVRMPDGKDPPFLVTNKYGQGITIFVASGEVWRLRQYKEVYFERFWTKLSRYASTGSRRKQDRRGRILMSKEFPSGSYIRLQAQLLDADLKPVARTVEPKMAVYPLQLDAYRTKDIEKEHKQLRKQFTLSSKAGRQEDWQGYFSRQILANPEQFPPGQWRVEVEIPSSSETLKEKFTIRPSNPETDNTRPDLSALAAVAGDVEEVANRVADKTTVEQLRSLAPRTADGQKLAFKFDNRASLDLIPQFMVSETKTQRNRGKVEDEWDKGPELPRWMTSWYDRWYDRPPKTYHVGWLLLLAIGLLSAEWLTRKLLRLA